MWLILSGKGGVGKSTMSAQLAVTLAATGSKVRSPPPRLLPLVLRSAQVRAFSLRASERGYDLQEVGLTTEGWQVALLDVDLCGPSIPRVLGLEGKEVHFHPLPHPPYFC